MKKKKKREEKVIKVVGQDPSAIIRQMGTRHHIEVYKPMVSTIAMTLLFESYLARDNKVHSLYQSRTGAGSYGLYLADGREFHFRPGGAAPEINVYDAYMKGNVVATLKSPSQARKFLRGLSYGLENSSDL